MKILFNSIYFSLFLFLSCITGSNSDKIIKNSNSPINDSCTEIQQKADELSQRLEDLDKDVKWLKYLKEQHEKQMKSLLDYSTNIAWRIPFKGVDYDIYVADLDANTFRLYNKSKSGVKYDFKNIEAEVKKQGSRLTLAMNAGMYLPNHDAQGLYIENGKTITAIDKAKDKFGNFYLEPNGVFYINKNNEPFVVSTQQMLKVNLDSVQWATQSGPMLLHNGKINALFKVDSPNKNIRNGVAIIDTKQGKKIVFAISNKEVSFHDFASLFEEVFKAEEALYLDGAISQLYVPELQRTNSTGKGLGPILTLIR